MHLKTKHHKARTRLSIIFGTTLITYFELINLNLVVNKPEKFQVRMIFLVKVNVDSSRLGGASYCDVRAQFGDTLSLGKILYGTFWLTLST